MREDGRMRNGACGTPGDGEKREAMKGAPLRHVRTLRSKDLMVDKAAAVGDRALLQLWRRILGATAILGLHGAIHHGEILTMMTGLVAVEPTRSRCRSSPQRKTETALRHEAT